jgi:hypothetical protein
MKRISTYLLFIAITGLISCKTVKVDKPQESYNDGLPVPKTSVVTFTTQSKIKDIQTELNKSVSGLIYEDNSLENNGGDNIMVKAWKQGDIVIDMKDNTLSYSVPLKTWIKSGFSISKFGLSVSDYRELNAALALKFNTRLTLNHDWTVTTKTTSAGYEWLTTPTIKVGGIDISVKFVADMILQSSLKKVGAIIDDNIKEYLDFKPYIEEAWNLSGKPVKLNDQYNVWLKLSPQKIISSALVADKGVIKHKAGMTGTVSLTIGSEPEPEVGVKPLPDLLLGDLPTENTTVYAYVKVPYNELTNTASKFAKGKTFEQGRRKVTVEDIKIYGSGTDLVAETTLTGSLTGTIYFKGKPAYNASDSTIIIQDFDYDLSTKNFLIKSASWLYQDGFKRLIANQLKWSISNEMSLVKSAINSNLKAYKLSDGIVLSGSVTKVQPGSIYILPDGIISEIGASGKFNINIENLDSLGF